MKKALTVIEMYEKKIKNIIPYEVVILVCFCLPTFAGQFLTPTGTYDVRISLSDNNGTEFWYREVLNCGTNLTQPYKFYQEGGNQITLRMAQPASDVSDITSIEWFIDANGEIAPEDILGNNRGKLKITVSNLKFQESANPFFQSEDTFLYYIGNDNGWMVPRPIPGDKNNASPAWWILQRSPICPLTSDDPENSVFGPSYGTPTWHNSPTNGISFEFPDLYVTPSQISQISFGAGFTTVPEPTLLSLLILGGLGVMQRKKT